MCKTCVYWQWGMRNRVRRNYCLDPKYITRLRERAAIYDGGNLSRAVERAIDEADGNARGIRHDCRGSLCSISMHAAIVRTATRHPEAIGAVEAIERAVVELAKRLDRTA